MLYLTCTSAVDLKHNKLTVRQMFISEVLHVPPMPLLPVAFCELHIFTKLPFAQFFPPDWWKNNVSLQMLHLYKQWSAMPSERPFCKKTNQKNIGRTKALTAWKTHKQNTLVDTTGLQSGCFISFRLRDSSILLLYDLPPTEKKNSWAPVPELIHSWPPLYMNISVCCWNFNSNLSSFAFLLRIVM